MNENEIIKLANECLQCKKPTCVDGCLNHNNIPLMIKKVQEGNFKEAKKVLDETTTLPSICSLVCPSEKQCMGHCIKNKINKAVNIPLIEQFVSSFSSDEKRIINKIDKKVAIIGSGPAGLACGEVLALKGVNIDIYDSYSTPGGILTYGIPDFVLDKNIVVKKIDELKSLGVNFILNKALGKDIFISSLCEKYDAIFLAIGASVGKKMNIENENIKNIVDANLFLKDMYENNLDAYQNVKDIIVIGGGNTAIDAARVAKRKFNANVSIVYRRSENEMPARKNEILQAKNENIEFCFLTNPVRFIGKDSVVATECVMMKLIDDKTSRPYPVEIKNSNFTIASSLVIEAISSSIDTSILQDIKTNSWGGIIVNENMQTSNELVFAGGDCVSGPSYVVTAMNDGIVAAKKIYSFLEK
ncbi:MAG: FAD-dependent oxidoreductase [Erysipelotrichaceae bacterium]|nr:FAD-dependent oxidoreductase [Erysipelotrichaceae bacterium]